MDIVFYKKAKMTVPLIGEDGKQKLDTDGRTPLTQTIETDEDIVFETHESELLKSALQRFTKLYKSEFKDFSLPSTLDPAKSLKDNKITAESRLRLLT